MRAALTILAAVLLSSCQATQGSLSQRAAMIVLPNATDVKSAEQFDGQITYRVAEPYPAKRAIADINQQLRGMGWRPRERDLLNPDSSYSMTARWRAVATNDGRIWGWSEQWENDRGDVVAYSFSYSTTSVDGPPDSKVPMEVLVAYFKSPRVKELERRK